jgi:hypothetical protein
VCRRQCELLTTTRAVRHRVYENCDIAPVISGQLDETSMADGAHLRGVMPYAVDPKGAEQLRTLSERLLDLKFL